MVMVACISGGGFLGLCLVLRFLQRVVGKGGATRLRLGAQLGKRLRLSFDFAHEARTRPPTLQVVEAHPPQLPSDARGQGTPRSVVDSDEDKSEHQTGTSDE
jgi:hypothetical protein